MKKALITIDYTNDFVATDGALTCGEPGQAIVNKIVKLNEDFVNDGQFVVMAVDLHQQGDPYHPETSLFPPHNIEGTSGRDLYGDLQQWFEDHRDDVYYMDKTRYSAFSGTDLDLKLKERGISEVHLVGVCTDICVLHTAVDAYNLGYQIVVHRDAVASFNLQGHEWALGHFTGTLGAVVK